MNLNNDDILQLASMIWEGMLALPIEPGATGNDSAAGPRVTAACVRISGAWNGAVLLECGADVARRAASIMFGGDATAMIETELQDAVAELANMIGGNIKALLPETCYLSLPSVVEGGDYSTRVTGGRVANRVEFSCVGCGVAITVIEKAETQSAAA